MDRNITFDFIASGDLIELRQHLSKAINKNVQSVIILSCSSNNLNLTDLNSILTSCTIPVFGGIFPGLIYDGQFRQKGIMLIYLNIVLESATFTELSDKGTSLISNIQQNYRTLSKHKNFLIFADSLSDRCEEFIDLFYEVFGNGINVIGGGAGSLALSKLPAIFSNRGLMSDAIQVVGLPSALRSCTAHGWEIADGPFLVTQSHKNHLISLNYEPAFSVYANAINKISDTPLTSGNFMNIAKNFPLGIRNISGELLIRDPVSTNNNELFCVGEVPTNFLVYVLKSSAEQLIDASQTSAMLAKSARDEHSNDKLDIAVVFDCISRFLYLADDYHLELSSMQQALGENQKMIGVMSLGEIANLPSGNLAFLNKSTVVGSM